MISSMSYNLWQGRRPELDGSKTEADEDQSKRAELMRGGEVRIAGQNIR